MKTNLVLGFHGALPIMLLAAGLAFASGCSSSTGDSTPGGAGDDAATGRDAGGGSPGEHRDAGSPGHVSTGGEASTGGGDDASAPSGNDATAPSDSDAEGADAGSNASDDSGFDAPPTMVSDAGIASITTAPTSPPARICGDTALLTGPATAPAGAVTVSTTDDLNALTQSSPAGTTFWLAPGTHMATGQVVTTGKDGDTYLGAPGAILDGTNVGQYPFAFTQPATNITIRYLTIQNFGQAGDNQNQGVVNHDSGDGWVIEYNTIIHNAGAGTMIGSNNVVRYNCLQDNGQYGFNAYSADTLSNVILDHNEIAGNNTDNWEVRQPGCGCTGGGKFWMTQGAAITNNWVHDNIGPGLWADTNNNGLDFEGNYIQKNDGEGIMYEISYNGLIKYNTFLDNAWVGGAANPGFPTGAIYLSESGGEPRVSSTNSTFEVSDNVFTDNWSGVILWENADRFVGNPDYGTLSNMLSDASSTKCYDAFDPTHGSSASPVTPAPSPYTADCRWHTQNVAIHDNTFSLTVANITGCTNSAGCGYNGIFSNWGSEYSWEPYLGDVVEENITFNQNNVFSNNTYSGPWMFMPHDQGTSISFSTWQATPYKQDVGSTMQ